MCAGATHRLWGRHTVSSGRVDSSRGTGRQARIISAIATCAIAGAAIGGIRTDRLADTFAIVPMDDVSVVAPRLASIMAEPATGARGFGEVTRIMMLGDAGSATPRLAMNTSADISPIASTLASADTWRSGDIDTVVPRSEKPKPGAASASDEGDEDGTLGERKNHGRVLYKGTFDNVDSPAQIPEWRLADDSRAPLSTTPTGRRFLGELSNGGAKLAVQNVPTEGTVEVEFDVFAINAWDGNGGADATHDAWGVRVNGGKDVAQELFVTNFAAVGDGRDQRQSYPAPLGKGDYPAGTAAAELNTLGYAWNGEPMDAVYRIKLSFKPTDENVEIEFFGKNLQTDDGQAWGLDNVVVRSVPLGSAGGGAGGWASNINSLGDFLGDGQGLPDYLPRDLGNVSTPSTGGGGGGGGSTPEPDPTPDVPAPATLGVLALAGLATRRRR